MRPSKQDKTVKSVIGGSNSVSQSSARKTRKDKDPQPSPPPDYVSLSIGKELPPVVPTNQKLGRKENETTLDLDEEAIKRLKNARDNLASILKKLEL